MRTEILASQSRITTFHIQNWRKTENWKCLNDDVKWFRAPIVKFKAMACDWCQNYVCNFLRTALLFIQLEEGFPKLRQGSGFEILREKFWREISPPLPGGYRVEYLRKTLNQAKGSFSLWSKISQTKSPLQRRRNPMALLNMLDKTSRVLRSVE